MRDPDPRARRLLEGFRDKLSLDLRGAVIATEAGSGPFLYSCLAAALAGADRVVAVAPDSHYATHQEIGEEVTRRVRAWGLSTDRVRLLASRNDIPAGIDIFLNLGFLRPLDRFLLSKGSEHAVVSYMCEAWEYRPGDVDMAFCQEHGIPVAGVNENYLDFGVFDSCGQLALKLLFEAGVEVAGCRIAVVSGDRFGVVIDKALQANCADSRLLSDAALLTPEIIQDLDALVIASYSQSENMLASCALLPPEIAQINPQLKVLQFAGSIDVMALGAAGIACYPATKLLPYRMAFTLAHLGPRPVLALHSLGLKVGERLFRYRSEGKTWPVDDGLVQPIQSGRVQNCNG